GLSFFPRADIMLHGLQLLLLGATAFLLYRVLSQWVTQSIAIIIACLFALIPGNSIFASYMMTETATQFLFMLFLFVFLRFLKTNRSDKLGLAILLISATTLIRYSFVVFLPLLIGIAFFKRPAITNKSILYGVLGVILLSFWIFTNHAITGIWGLSDTHGIQLYNQIVWIGKTLPRETTPALIRLRSLLPPGTDLKQPYYNLQSLLLKPLYYEWAGIDDILGSVATQAVLQYPLQWIRTSLQSFWDIHTKGITPYWLNVGNIGGDGPVQPPFCETLTPFVFCQPIIRTPWSYPLWNAYVAAGTFFYQRLYPLIALLILFPSFFVLIIWGNVISRWLVALYLI
ncbi:MAG: hypothetical protein AAB649_02835, partial [Patescibacteria group bacterium]